MINNVQKHNNYVQKNCLPLLEENTSQKSMHKYHITLPYGTKEYVWKEKNK
jgi:hypothetical protein